MRIASIFHFILAFLVLAVLPACSSMNTASRRILTDTGLTSRPVSKSQGKFKVGNPYQVFGVTYRPRETYSYSETGIASWYGPNFHGKPTANGETFDMYELTAAHKTLQIPSLVRVTNLENGRSLVVRVNDRGPFKRGRIIDLSMRSAELLGFKNQGVAKVRLDLLAEESKAIARAAKSGQDTSGVEVAMNEHGRIPDDMYGIPADRAPQPVPTQEPLTRQPASYQSAQTAQAPQQQAGTGLRPVDRVELKAPNVPGHMKDGKFLPDPVVKQVPVPNTNIFVQAGSFSNQANAEQLANALKPFGRAEVYPTNVNGQQFFRVRIGPMQDVSAADMVLENMASAGRGEALIVVD